MSIVYSEKVDKGRIDISHEVIAELVLYIIKKYDKQIYITNDKGKRTSKVYKTIGGSSATNIEVTSKGEEIEVKIYIIVTFGKSIEKITDDLMENIRKSINMVVGKNPKVITIVITGTKSKKTVKRNIEVRREYDI